MWTVQVCWFILVSQDICKRSLCALLKYIKMILSVCFDRNITCVYSILKTPPFVDCFLLNKYIFWRLISVSCLIYQMNVAFFNFIYFNLLSCHIRIYPLMVLSCVWTGWNTIRSSLHLLHYKKALLFQFSEWRSIGAPAECLI